MIRISHTELFNQLNEILLNNGFEKNNAELCANIFTENTLVGVSSHGVNRFDEFIGMVKSGHIKPNSKPDKIMHYMPSLLILQIHRLVLLNLKHQTCKIYHS